MNKPTEKEQATYNKLKIALNKPRKVYTYLIIECILLALLREVQKIKRSVT